MTHPTDKGFERYWILNPISRFRAFFNTKIICNLYYVKGRLDEQKLNTRNSNKTKEANR